MNVKLFKCSSCGILQSPPAYLCRSCKSEKLEETEIPGKGTLRTYSTVYVPLASLEKEAPYTVAIVELNGGCKVTGRILETSSDKLSVGIPVEVSEVKDGVYLFKLSY